MIRFRADWWWTPTRDAGLKAGLISLYVHPDDQIKVEKAFEIQPLLHKGEGWLVEIRKAYNPRTLTQNALHREIVYRICTDVNSSAYGSDPDLVHEGILLRGMLEYGYPVVEANGIKVPKRTHTLDTKEFQLLFEIDVIIAGETGTDISDLPLIKG